MNHTISLDLDGLSLLLDEKLTIPCNMQGLRLLQAHLQAAAKAEKQARQNLLEKVKTYYPPDYSRVCHCGRARGADPCDGCPGQSGAGKVLKYDVHGKPEALSLEELGLL